MLDLYLIRHAESEHNKTRHLIGGRSNSAQLSQKGVMQAQLLGKRLATDKVSFDNVYSSPALRAYETAKIACTEIGFPIDKIMRTEDLLELSQGDWEGQLREKVYTPDMLSKIIANNWEFRPPNGESQKDVEERVYNWINKNLVPRYKDDLVAGIFTHDFAIRCLLRAIMDFSPKMTYKVALDNTSINRLSYTDHGWHIVCINDAAHLLDSYASNDANR